MDVTVHLKELPFEALLRLLEEGYEDSPRHPVEAYPKLLPWAIGFKEVEEDVTEGVCPRWLHKIANALTKTQLLGCSWAGATLTSVKSARSKLVSGKQSLICLKWRIRRIRVPQR